MVTDFDVQGMWLTRHVERYFVALDETRAHLERLGVPPVAITVSGIPIDPVFAVPKDQRAVRANHDLAPDRTTILVSAGGFGVGPVEALVHTLLELRHSAQLVVICGRSEELKTRLDELAAARPRHLSPALRVVGYTTEMDEYMAKSDLLVGKPRASGPSASSTWRVARHRRTRPERTIGHRIAPATRPATRRRCRTRNTMTDGSVNTTAPDIMTSMGVSRYPIHEARPTEVTHSD